MVGQQQVSQQEVTSKKSWHCGCCSSLPQFLPRAWSCTFSRKSRESVISYPGMTCCYRIGLPKSLVVQMKWLQSARSATAQGEHRQRGEEQHSGQPVKMGWALSAGNGCRSRRPKIWRYSLSANPPLIWVALELIAKRKFIIHHIPCTAWMVGEGLLKNPFAA